ncbi:MAG: hypothetical protein GX808_03875 [Syntrophomonadaceae bacterium]|nr:hypothetical protein [Syntrophomonadaceae bacterium]
MLTARDDGSGGIWCTKCGFTPLNHAHYGGCKGKQVAIEEWNRRPVDSENAQLRKELERYQKWVNDLQSGMYVNCVYCGHRYGPNDKVPASMADVLKEHIEKCPEHPMSKLRAELEQVKAERDAAVEDLKSVCEGINSCAFCIHDLRGTEENWPTEHCSPQWRETKEYCWRWRGLEGRA